MGRACRVAGLALVWASVAVISYGAHLQTLSPRYAEYVRQVIDEQAGTGGEERLNPAGRMALVLALSWQFSCCFSGSVASAFTAGALGIRAVGRRYPGPALLAAGVFGLGCLLGAALGVGEAVRSLHWGFATLGVGHVLAAAGLGVGGLGVAWSQTPNQALQQTGPPRAAAPLLS